MRRQPIVDPILAAEYRAAGWWSDTTLADVVAGHALAIPDLIAIRSDHGNLTWSEYDAAADRIGSALANAGYAPGDRVAVWMSDSASVHATYIGAERAGVVVVGIGARAGEREVSHLIRTSGARGLVTLPEHRGVPSSEVITRLRKSGVELDHHVVVPYVEVVGSSEILVDGSPVSESAVELTDRSVGPDELFLINSTSGTTGLPKCVTHFQNRWTYFHQKAVQNGELTADDVIYGAVPAPFGFGIWTSHFTPALLGAVSVVSDSFDAGRALELIERERVTVLCCVSTQFGMMMSDPAWHTADLSSLRVMFTGGEAIPFERAVAFEERTGCVVLQFFGSNETGVLSATSLRDSREHRLHTAGLVVPEMHVRLYEDGVDVTSTGRGQPACRGPATCAGYLDDDGSSGLFTDDGWMLMGDVCTLDDGYLTVVGRISDIIIRGGKNISAAQVEEEVSTHPEIVLAAAVAYPDNLFGERVCVYAELRPGCDLTLDDLLAHLAERGTSKEIRPERLIVLDSLPRSSGGKVAKGELRADVRRRSAREGTRSDTARSDGPKGRSSEESRVRTTEVDHG